MERNGKVNFWLKDLEQYDLIYLSLGAGLQSSVLYYMACLKWPGMPEVAYAAFSDPGDEPQHTYETLARLIEFGKQTDGPPIHIISKDGTKLSEAIFSKDGNRWASIPGFTRDHDGKVGMLRRQCTPEYKIKPLVKYAKQYLGIKPRKHVGNRRILSLQGITTDEATRMKAPAEEWSHAGYPLITMRFNRHDCEMWLAKQGLPAIEKSACVYCPYHSNHEWRQIKRVAKDWELACKVDTAIRDSTSAGATQPVYLHRSCVPLAKVNLEEDNTDLFSNECEGYCGI